MTNQQQNSKEAKVLGKYILGNSIHDEAANLYNSSLSKLPLIGDSKEDELVLRCVQSPWLIPYIDGVLSLRNPDHLLKKKLHRMFAILECQTEYAEYFLSKEYNFFKTLSVFITGARGVLKALIGFIIYPFVRV
jgi:hypothetical protein